MPEAPLQQVSAGAQRAGAAGRPLPSVGVPAPQYPPPCPAPREVRDPPSPSEPLPRVVASGFSRHSERDPHPAPARAGGAKRLENTLSSSFWDHRVAEEIKPRACASGVLLCLRAGSPFPAVQNSPEHSSFCVSANPPGRARKLRAPGRQRSDVEGAAPQGCGRFSESRPRPQAPLGPGGTQPVPVTRACWLPPRCHTALEGAERGTSGGEKYLMTQNHAGKASVPREKRGGKRAVGRPPSFHWGSPPAPPPVPQTGGRHRRALRPGARHRERAWLGRAGRWRTATGGRGAPASARPLGPPFARSPASAEAPGAVGGSLHPRFHRPTATGLL